jgi:hypothetical protein
MDKFLKRLSILHYPVLFNILTNRQRGALRQTLS